MSGFLLKKYLFCFLLLVLCYLFLISPPNHLTQWQRIKIKGHLTWVTRPSLLTHYNSLDGIIGLEYDILKNFCDHHGLVLNVIDAPSNGALFELLNNNNVDVAGANLTKTTQRTKNYMTSMAYDNTAISIISALSRPAIKSVSALAQLKGAILNNSSYEEIADQLKTEAAVIDKVDDKSLYELLQMVISGDLDYTFADNNLIAIYRAYMPQLRMGIELSEMYDLVFILPHVKWARHDDSVKKALDAYIEVYKKEGKITEYKQLIVDSLPNSKPADTVQFLKNYKKRWATVEPLILQVAKENDLSPILLGSISYQESHWNAKAVSPTSVKGLMMLTKAVAKEQGISDRLDPLQSLQGGARYFLKMKDKIPKRINESDKINFALAAYNIGFRNLEKARVLTQRSGQNPDLWKDVKLYLPKLNELPGYKIDGKTAVRYVENILIYQNLLQWKQQQ